MQDRADYDGDSLSPYSEWASTLKLAFDQEQAIPLEFELSSNSGRLREGWQERSFEQLSRQSSQIAEHARACESIDSAELIYKVARRVVDFLDTRLMFPPTTDQEWDKLASAMFRGIEREVVDLPDSEVDSVTNQDSGGSNAERVPRGPGICPQFVLSTGDNIELDDTTWALANHLWSEPSRRANFEDEAFPEAVFGDRCYFNNPGEKNKRIGDLLGSYRTRFNDAMRTAEESLSIAVHASRGYAVLQERRPN